MRSVRVSGTEGYAEEAAELLKRYESIPATESHRPVLHLIPGAPCSVLDIGSGTGRDAAWFAAMEHRVVAVEPTDELRIPAMGLHPSPLIQWLNDSLPNLNLLMIRREMFDVVMLTAVWMHLDGQQRRHAMPRVAGLIREGGVMVMSLRHGPVPPLGRMFDVSAEETTQLAQAQGLLPILHQRTQSIQNVNRIAAVTWTRLAFKKLNKASRHSRESRHLGI